MLKKYVLLLFLFLLQLAHANAADIIINNLRKVSIGNQISIYVDKSRKLTIADIIKINNFTPSDRPVPNLGVEDHAFWIKFTLINKTDEPSINLEIAHPVLDKIELYTPTDSSNNSYQVKVAGEAYPFDSREYKDPSFIFKLDVPQNARRTFYIKIISSDNIQLPISIGSEQQILESARTKDPITGLYLGIMLAMLLYNLFVYFTVKDNSYLYYVVYLVMVILTQASIQGYTFEYLWPNNTWMAINSSFIFPPLVGIAGLEFERHFLKTKTFLPKWDRFAPLFTIFYSLSIILALFAKYSLAFKLIEVTATAISLYIFFLAVKISKMGYRPANFFLVSWSVFLVGVIIYTLKDFGILPYNNFTYYTMPIGSAFEVILLSFALADKINMYKKEKEESQAEALRISTENVKLVREQNIVLETKVKERTLALENTNHNLENALSNLKEAQSQLVDAEKMASLGQLTAGIAHEINNPINFVTSNVRPLKLDFEDLMSVINKYEGLDPSGNVADQIEEIEAYKRQIDLGYLNTEIATLLSGIDDGARRTAEIVRSLRTFSRLDETDLKPTDLHEGLNSTITLLNHNIPGYLEIQKEFGNIPKIECYPGKLNQVFMNLIGNAIQAIKQKELTGKKEFITIKTELDDNEQVKISIKDTGIGMSPEVQKRIFEPFFTTKDVGEGTGLGLSIVFSVIEKHKGHIDVHSEEGKGTEFVITLPINLKQLFL